MNQEEKDNLDQLLDGMLARYCAAEPRAGLEERILANLRSHAGPRSSVSWMTVAAAAIAIVVAVMLLKFSSPPTPDPVRRITVETLTPARIMRSRPREPRSSLSPHRTAPKFVHAHERMGRQKPREQQFPSPVLLSSEEHLLLTYVQREQQRKAKVITPQVLGQSVAELRIAKVEIQPLASEP